MSLNVISLIVVFTTVVPRATWLIIFNGSHYGLSYLYLQSGTEPPFSHYCWLNPPKSIINKKNSKNPFVFTRTPLLNWIYKTPTAAKYSSVTRGLSLHNLITVGIDHFKDLLLLSCPILHTRTMSCRITN